LHSLCHSGLNYCCPAEFSGILLTPLAFTEYSVEAMDKLCCLKPVGFTLLIVVIAVGAFTFRVPRLEQRPMHTDEAVHAVKLGILLDTGTYTYNPHEYHGPTLYYFSLPFVWLSGARSYADMDSEIPMRLVPVVFGAGLILLLLLTADGLGRPAAACAGVLTAVSPAMVYYSRYYIQEILLVFFTFGAIAAGWRYIQSKHFGWALAAGACLGFMYASKETWVIAFGCMLASAGITTVWGGRIRTQTSLEAPPESNEGEKKPNGKPSFHPWHVAAAVAAALVVAVLCLTVMLTQPRAILDSLLTYIEYVQRAVTGDSSTSGPALHNHPWYYYLRMLTFAKYGPGPWWSEVVILALALIGICEALRKRGRSRLGDLPGTIPHFLRFLALYTVLMTVIYSVIPYKTPWCMLSFLHGMILMAGVGAAAVYRRLSNSTLRSIWTVLLILGMGHLGVQAHRSSFRFHSDPRNPYVYAHTSTDLLKLINRAEQIAEVHPDGHDMLIRVIVPESDYWPLPWYFRRFARVGYWDTVPDEPDAALIVAGPSFEPRLDGALRDSYQKEYFGLRPHVLLMTYVRSDLWDKYIEGQK